MSRERKFDWEGARKLREKGFTYTQLAKLYGVSPAAVYLALNPELRARVQARNAEWQRAGVCPVCGGPATRTSVRQHRCKVCYDKTRVKVRDGEAYCPNCATWKPLVDFTPSQKHPARGVRNECRACETTRRREHRRRQKTKAAA